MPIAQAASHPHCGFHQSSGSANGRELFQGPKGGVYYKTAAGHKVYQK